MERVSTMLGRPLARAAVATALRTVPLAIARIVVQRRHFSSDLLQDKVHVSQLKRTLPTAAPAQQAPAAAAAGGVDDELSKEAAPVHPLVMKYLKMTLNSKVYNVMAETPLTHAIKLSEKQGNRIYLKREDLTPVFSFKLRGAYNKISSLTPEEKARGVCCNSAGNHAQGVAYACKALGISAKIFMPVSTPALKIDGVKKFGAEIVLVGNTVDDAGVAARECAATEGRVLVHPYNDPLVIAGQGTIGMEIMKQCRAIPQADNVPHAVFVCCGGGGMLAGIGAYIKATYPEVKIIGVNPVDSPGMTVSLQNGKVTPLDFVGTFADGTAIKLIGQHGFDVCQQVVDEMITVSADEICAAIKDVFAETRVVVEPSGALAVAGAKRWIESTGSKGKDHTLVCILSGANIDFDKLRFVSERADTSETLLSVITPERPGAFFQVYESIFPRQVTEFACRQSSEALADGAPAPPQPSLSESMSVSPAEGQASVFISFRAKSPEDEAAVIKTLEEKGFYVANLTKNELARTHGRHLVGGRAPQLHESEKLFNFEFPEKAGALRDFLQSVSGKRYNVSLWSYHNFGSDGNRVLVGFSVRDGEEAGFEEWLNSLPYKRTEETGNPMYKLFLSGNRIRFKQPNGANGSASAPAAKA